MILFAREILKEKPGATFVSEVKCSQTLYDDIEKRGGKAIMWKAGHSLIKAKMAETGAELAGEMSGHMFFKNRYFGFDDAIYSTLRLLEILTKTDKPLSALLADLPKTYSTPELRTDFPEEVKFKAVAATRDALKAKGRTLTIVCATSGDTGGAAVEAFRGRANIRVVSMFPDGRISEVQRRYMTTPTDDSRPTLSPTVPTPRIRAVVEVLLAVVVTVRPGVTTVRSLMSFTPASCNCWALTAVTTIGTSCRFWVRFCAVTTSSSIVRESSCPAVLLEDCAFATPAAKINENTLAPVSNSLTVMIKNLPTPILLRGVMDRDERSRKAPLVS